MGLLRLLSAALANKNRALIRTVLMPIPRAGEGP